MSWEKKIFSYLTLILLLSATSLLFWPEWPGQLYQTANANIKKIKSPPDGFKMPQWLESKQKKTSSEQKTERKKPLQQATPEQQKHVEKKPISKKTTPKTAPLPDPEKLANEIKQQRKRQNTWPWQKIFTQLKNATHEQAAARHKKANEQLKLWLDKLNIKAYN